MRFKQAHYYCSTSNRANALKGLNIYKSLYVQSLINDSQNSKKRALEGLIYCSEKLGLPTEEYEKELGIKRRGKAKKKPRVLKNSLYKILLGKGYIDFFFRYPLKSSDIKTSTLKSRSIYKKIYDITGKLTIGTKRYTLRSIKRMRIAQYNSKTIRIVLEDTRPIRSKLAIQGSKLRIYLVPSRSSSDKSAFKTGSFKSDKKSKAPAIVSNASKVIVIDPGHGGKDTGAIGYKRKREKDIVLSIAKKVYKELKKKGFRVYLTRRGDYFVTLRSRTRMANRVKANLFLSIHANAAPNKRKYLSMKGVETFFLSPARSERAKRIAALENRVDMKNLSYYSKNVFLNFINREKTILSNKLAIDVHRSILAHLRKKYSVKDGGVRPGPFWVLVGAQMPSILVEVGYITNPTEAMRLSNPLYQRYIAKGIAEGIENYFLHTQSR